MKRMLAVMLASWVCLSGAVTSYATSEPAWNNNESQQMERWESISKITSSLSVSGRKLTANGQVKTKTSGYKIQMRMVLQKSNGGVWSDIKSWNSSNDYICTLTHLHYASPGKYRLVVKADIYENNVMVKSGSRTSSIVTV